MGVGSQGLPWQWPLLPILCPPSPPSSTYRNIVWMSAYHLSMSLVLLALPSFCSRCLALLTVNAISSPKMSISANFSCWRWSRYAPELLCFHTRLSTKTISLPLLAKTDQGKPPRGAQITHDQPNQWSPGLHPAGNIPLSMTKSKSRVEVVAVLIQCLRVHHQIYVSWWLATSRFLS